MSILCDVIGHRRSAKRAKFNFEMQRWESICVQCRGPMIRIAHGQWDLAAEVRKIEETELA